MKMPLTALPNELLLQISSYLHPRHHSALIQTNHRLHGALSDALIVSLCQPSGEITSNGSNKWALRALYSALKSQDAETVQRLVSRGVASVVGKPGLLSDMSGDTGGDRALLNHAIVTLRSTDTARLLLQCGVTADTKESVSGWTPLFRAIELRKEDMVRLLVNREDVDVNSLDHRSFTPLYMVVSWYKEEGVARALLDDPRVDINRQYHQAESTALHLAVRSKSVGVVRALLDRQDIHVNAPDKYGRTPLHIAVAKRFTKGVEALVERPDVRLDSIDFRGRTVLHLAATARGGGGMLRFLLAQDERRLPPVNLRESVSGYTPLHLAVAPERLGAMNVLLADSRVDANVLDDAGVTPLYRAIEAGLSHIVTALLESGKVDVNASTSAHVSPIYRAAAMGHERLLRMLLDHPGSDLARAIGGTDIEDPSACEGMLPDVSRNMLVEYLLKGNTGQESAGSKI